MIMLAYACGGAAEPAARSTTPAAEPAASEPAAEAHLETSGAIDRVALEAVLDEGLGRFLQGVRTEPHFTEGSFVGFRLESLFPGDERVASVDLVAGDVVTRVNGESIERPEQALRVWNGLRVASELLIEYQRGDHRRELRFEIVD